MTEPLILEDLFHEIAERVLEEFIEDRETLSLMVLAEKSLEGFLGEEPDVYSVKDVKVKYRWRQQWMKRNLKLVEEASIWVFKV